MHFGSTISIKRKPWGDTLGKNTKRGRGSGTTSLMWSGTWQHSTTWQSLTRDSTSKRFRLRYSTSPLQYYWLLPLLHQLHPIKKKNMKRMTVCPIQHIILGFLGDIRVTVDPSIWLSQPSYLTFLGVLSLYKRTFNVVFCKKLSSQHET